MYEDKKHIGLQETVAFKSEMRWKCVERPEPICLLNHLGSNASSGRKCSIFCTGGDL